MFFDNAWAGLALEHGVTFARDRCPNADVTLNVPGWPGPAAYRIRATSEPLRPSRLLDWAHQTPDGGPVKLLIMTPSASERVLDLAHQLRVSVITTSSNTHGPIRGALFSHDGRQFHIEPEPQPSSESVRPRGRIPWGLYAVALQTLTDFPDRPTQTELARTLGLTQGRVSTVLRQLRNEVIHDPDPRQDITQWLLTAYPRGTRATTTWLTLDDPVDAANSVSRLLAERHIQHAVSGEVAADWIAPWSRPRTALIWAAEPTDLTDAGATPVSHDDANLILAVPADPYLLRSTRPSTTHPPTLEPWRVWLDLARFGDEEAADALKDRLMATGASS